MIEGELPEDGLAALEGDGQEVFLALARRLTEQDAGDGRSLEALFAQTKEIEAQADDYLVAGSWVSAAEMRTGPPPIERLPNGERDDRAQGVCAEKEPDGAPAARQTSSDTNGHRVDVQELARLVHRPKSRPKSVPDGQLRLFDD